MSTISAMIIEDEEPGRLLIKKYLEDQQDITLIGVCENGFDGARIINKEKPDLIFLDVQMPKINGFEMLEIIDCKPEIIFTTAYNEYAIKAFELNAIDYLLKPYSKDRFLKALDKARTRILSGNSDMKSSSIISELPEEYLKRIVVRNRSNIHVINTENIVLIVAQDDYVMIYTPERSLLKQQTMKYYEEHLNPAQFIRVHRSYIVNVNYIRKLEPYEKDGYLIVLKNQIQGDGKIKVSKSGYHKLKQVLRF